MKKINIFWFRRDLRLEDNAGLFHALNSKLRVLPIFIFDKNILDRLEDKDDARVSFLHDTLSKMQAQLKGLGTDILVKYGYPEDVLKEIIAAYDIEAVYTNEDYESYAIERDKKIETLLSERNIPLHKYKDHIIFSRDEVVKDDGTPYTVFTPYSRKWKAKLTEHGGSPVDSFYLKAYPTEKYFDHFIKKPQVVPIPKLEEMGFTVSTINIPSKTVAQGIIKSYDQTRNFPAINGTSKLGIHFRFGTISIREKAGKTIFLNETYLNELIWRDFYAMILFHFPHVEKGAFRTQYDNIEWRDSEQDFTAWCEGVTGYPIVDAGMRELANTGYMHNRVRMITASFLTKHLLLDWRLGEAWFARKLLDFDLASNNGGWQWAAGSGTDAAPYFRIFNPTTQMEKFDKDLKYVKKWVPEYGTSKYPKPIVEHKMARERCLEVYKAALK
jgi:deoxyribodipyrimidine photo-lyase